MKNITRFSVERLNHEESQWILLPDGKLVLIVYFKKDVAGLKNSLLPATNTMRKECFVVFDRNGNLLYQL
ncbi:hypothetical protein FO440_20095 [Mucilaginibacter corticis]|uniref:Uncharacterized protein n=1 Tax=Mucilaginibacter corticis TaxID=2597670 RepID=A0A556MG36_9SPHI|nr:hypothetical protein [Mucilaginibacter corticis]TSJ38809.1 hypothetical protein FO440_20095 [Mucilaginibacter corticis]